MSNTTLATVPHFVGCPPFGDAFVAKIAGVGILRLCQLLQYTLLFLRNLFNSLIELIPCVVLYVLLPGAGGEDALFVAGLRSGL